MSPLSISDKVLLLAGLQRTFQLSVLSLDLPPRAHFTTLLKFSIMSRSIPERKRKELGPTDSQYEGDDKSKTSPSLKRPRHSRLQDNELCRRCARINLDEVLSREHLTVRGQLVKSLGPVKKWAIDSCSLCGLLATSLPPECRSSDSTYDLRSFSSKRDPRLGWKSIDTNMIGLDGCEFFVPQHHDATPVRSLKPDSIDFEILKSWLHQCQEMHTKTCTARTSSTSVPFMKLIDCETGKIVPASNHVYVSLSYLWGANSGSVEYSESLPEELPPTIEDAIIATRKLGFRFLWIDRYCINQQSADEKLAQVHKMDLIYQNSEITIIAAAGQDPTYGLPGVGQRTRSEQGCASIGKHFLISALGDPRGLVKKSAWITRGWTYQEGLLSRRRLVFTDQQVYYECYGMYCCEALNFPLHEMHLKSGQSLQKSFCEGEGVGIFPRGVGASPWEILQRVEEYSQKSLSHASDILNGILGILRAFESVHQVGHCSGIPILPAPKTLARLATDTAESSLWSPCTGFFIGLCWDLQGTSNRRPGFPSWSWAGWFGRIYWEFDEVKYLRTDPGIKLRLELQDGQIADLDTAQESLQKLNASSALSNIIRISAWTTPIQLLRYRLGYGRTNSEVECETRIELEDGGYLHWRFHPTTSMQLSTDHAYIGIHLAHEPSNPEGFVAPTGPALMVVCEVGDTMERVGFGWINPIKYQMYGADGVGEYDDDEDGPPLMVNSLYVRRPALVKSWREIRLG